MIYKPQIESFGEQSKEDMNRKVRLYVEACFAIQKTEGFADWYKQNKDSLTFVEDEE